MILRVVFIILVFCTACNSGEIPCATGKPLKLRKMGHYGINPVRKSHLTASVDKQKSQKRIPRPDINHDVKDLASLEDWDCPRPGMNKTSKVVQQSIKANKKKMTSYYKKSRQDSLNTSFMFNR